MTTLTRFVFVVRLLSLAGLLVGAAFAAAPADPFLGRWGLSLSTGAAGWLEVKQENGKLSGSLLWGGGSVLPLTSVAIADGKLTLTKVRETPAGKKAPAEPIIDTLTATIEGGALKGVRVDPRPNGAAAVRTEFTGQRSLPLPPRPDLAKVKFGAPVALFNGQDLAGWTKKEPNGESAWVVEGGVLINRVPPHAPGTPQKRMANLRTEREFGDFNLKVEVNVPAGSNSGVYLRGIYEIQVVDSFGKALDPHNMGALYSRITPSSSAEKPAGEWQTMDITLVARHLTVVLNGTKIIDNQPVLGCTGGAMWSDESKPGPIYLQGDHGTVSYRKIELRPVVK